MPESLQGLPGLPAQPPLSAQRFIQSQGLTRLSGLPPTPLKPQCWQTFQQSFATIFKPFRPKHRPTQGHLTQPKPSTRPSPEIAPTCLGASSHPQTQTGNGLVWTSPPPPNPKWQRSSLDKSTRFKSRGLPGRLNLNKHKKPGARASPNRAPAWSRWVPGKLDRCKEQIRRSEFERTVNP